MIAKAIIGLVLGLSFVLLSPTGHPTDAGFEPLDAVGLWSGEWIKKNRGSGTKHGIANGGWFELEITGAGEKLSGKVRGDIFENPDEWIAVENLDIWVSNKKGKLWFEVDGVSVQIRVNRDGEFEGISHGIYLLLTKTAVETN